MGPHSGIWSKRLTQKKFTIEFPVYNLFYRVVCHEVRKMQSLK
jgi:hypothetical protein